MRGSGCKTCPVQPCETMQYRGSTCAAQRANLGLGDPKTIADEIRSMGDEEMAIAAGEEVAKLLFHLLDTQGMCFNRTEQECVRVRLINYYRQVLKIPVSEYKSMSKTTQEQVNKALVMERLIFHKSEYMKSVNGLFKEE